MKRWRPFHDRAMPRYPTPRDALYREVNPAQAVFSIPLAQCIDALGFHFSPEAVTHFENLHPYTRVLQSFGKGDCDSYEQSCLRDYYQSFQPATAGDIFPEAARCPVGDLPANTHFTPWFSGSVQKRLQQTQSAIRREFPKITAPTNPVFGPVSDVQGAQEFARIVGIFNSISQHGYIVPKTRRQHVQVLTFRRDHEFRFMVTAGKHRVAALSVLGRPEITAVFRQPVIIHQEDSDVWPFVCDDGWDRDSALRYFDRLFAGRSCVGINREIALE